MILSNIEKAINTTKVVLECDSKEHENCPIVFTSTYRIAKRNLKQNNKILCKSCSLKIKNSGRKNPSCKFINIDDNLFEKIDTPEKAYCLGWIASDGSMSEKVLKLEIQTKDIEHLIFIKNLICKDLKIVSRVRIRNNKEYKTSYFTVCSKKIVKDCCRHLEIKFGRKCETIVYPNLKDDLDKYFLSGYFCGDGFISSIHKTKKYPVLCFYSSSINILNKINKKFNNSGYLYQSPKIFILEFQNDKAIFVSDFIFNNNSFFLDRKYNRYIEWKNLILLTKGQFEEQNRNQID